MHNRKGDLALSTNAIVVLIIAVLVLGLLISFITGALRKGEQNILGQLSKIPDPPAPSPGKPLTTTEVAIASRDDYAGFKFAVYNHLPDAATIRPESLLTSDCAPLETQVDFPRRTVSSRGYDIWTAQAKIKNNAPTGKTVCSITARIGTGADEVVANGDITIEVRT